MQSKTAFVLLGILKYKSLNPYEIIKILDWLNIWRWSPVSSSSVYTTIRTLEKKGFIQGRKEKNSLMPEKTIYDIAPTGSEAFMAALKEYICDDLKDITRYNLSTLFLCHCSKEEVISMLRERLVGLSYHYGATEQAYYHYMKELNVPDYALLSARHYLNFYKSEMASTEEAISVIMNAEGWGYLPTSGPFEGQLK